MTENTENAAPASDSGPALRQQAEERLLRQTAPLHSVKTTEDGLLLHELQVHQIELEIQNEELRQSQIALASLQSRYFDLFDLAPVGYLILSDKGTILEANLTAAKLLGTDRSRLVKQFLSRFILREDQTIFYYFYRQLPAADTLQECELRLMRNDGSVFWARLEATTEPDTDGAPICRVAVSDISERKQAEEALRQSERFAHAIIDALPAHLCVLDETGVIVTVNRAWRLFAEANPPIPANYGVGVNYLDICYRAAGVDVSEAVLFAGGIRQVMGHHLERFSLEYPCFSPEEERWFIGEVTRFPGDGPLRLIVSHRDITARKQAEKSLQVVLTKYKTLFDAFPLGITVSDQAGHIVETNAMAEKLLGISTAEHNQRQIDGDEWQIVRLDGSLMPPAEYASVRALTENRLVENAELGVVKPNGQTTWLNVTAAPIPLDGYGAIITYSDITARKQMELVLERTREDLRLAIDGANLGTYHVNLQSGHLVVNDCYRERFGYAPQELDLTHTNWLALIHPDDLPHVSRAQEKAYLGERNDFNMEYRLRHKSGRWIWVLDCGQAFDRDEQGRPWRAAGIHLDITARKQTEESLREREEQYRNLFENAPLCLFELDLSSLPPVVRRGNRRAEALYGWQVDEILTRPLTETIIPPTAPMPPESLDKLKAGETVYLEAQHQRRNGTLFPVRLTATSSPNLGLNRVIVAVEDITLEKEQLSAEKAIAEERLRISREIHDGVAQNLASLRLKVGLMHDWAEQDRPRLHAGLDFLQEQLRQNIQEVRRAIFALRPIAIDELGFYPALRQFIADFGEQNQLHINLIITGLADKLPSLLEPVLFRLIQEALNNVAKHARASTVWLELNIQAAWSVALTIRDDGIGFDPAGLPQAARHGHVGLTQMQERVAHLNGGITINSKPGQGTTLQINLPLPG